MQRELSPHISATRGFTIIEIILASALLLLTITVFVSGIVTAHESTVRASQSQRATIAAQEGLEIARALRDESFSSLVYGTSGFATSSGKWILSGASSTRDLITRELVISPVDSDTKQIQSRVTWQNTPLSTSTLSLYSTLARWRDLSTTQAQLFSIDVSGAGLSGDNKELRNITITNTSALNLEIARMTVSWTNTARKIERIKIDEETVWSKTGPGTPTGLQTSGTELDIRNFILEAGEDESIEIDNIKFNGNMSGNSFTILFTMQDSSTSTVNIF